MTRRKFRRTLLNQTITAYVPNITVQEIRAGKFWRYFATRPSNLRSSVTEISAMEYERLRKNPTIVTVQLKWIIKGPLDDTNLSVYTGRADGQKETVVIPGVRTQNQAAIDSAAEKIPILKQILSPSQYYFGE